ncbi:putative retrotransposon hot spot protein (RHS) [Trypanosoma cruzi]|uniref:Putative retrotransposon hot spot protein (RHS) n=1 Tax=Trypanosoma cruzi TaxID=5693 RepID=A0A2V2XFX0_TRYCR|nr:putative retrotransposon hot spot protein (RHS) [Trypanosoma cruzi]
MSGRPEEGLYGNLESQSSNVSQGGRRRTRSEFEGDTDYSSTTRRRLEGIYRPQWTMSSTVKDILLEGSTNMAEMMLNDFLRSNLGGRGVVDTNENVAMEMFVLRPTMFINDSEILGLITASPSYQELERELKREQEERKILLEAIYKLRREGVYFLWQWREYEGRDTLTPLASGKLNGLLAEIQKEERREADERAKREEEKLIREAEARVRQEAEERVRRREAEMKFTMSTNIEDVLFQGGVRVKDIKLNDFLLLEMEGKGIVDTNRSVLLEEFFNEPTEYIHDARVLNGMKTTVRYLKMGRAVMKEVDMEKVARMLHEKGVVSLEQWRNYEGKDTVSPLAKGTLDAALSRVQTSTSVVKSTVLEGLYESVYNASWSHVVEVSGSEGTVMKVEEGKPKQSWTYKEVGETREKDDSVQQSGEAPPVLMVLTSDKGWPYSWEEDEFIRDCHVNCEVERAWRIVEHYLNEWFIPHGGTNLTPGRLLLIGTPGIGKSMNAGSYLLYQLLHYDVEKLPVVLYVIGNDAFLFEKTTKTVTKYMGDFSIDDVLRSLSIPGVNAYIIYDVAKGGRKPYQIATTRGWGMIVLSSPNEDNFDAWEKYKSPKRIIMNCPEKDDVKAMCVWMKRNDSSVQAEYWKNINGRIDEVGTTSSLHL